MLIRLDFSSGVPIYMQIRNQIVLGIADGRIRPGERLPTIRALADEAGVNVMTVNKAYQLLKREGYILADRRSGAAVAARPGGTGELSEQAKSELKLIVSEAKLSGVSRSALTELVGRLYDEIEREE